MIFNDSNNDDDDTVIIIIIIIIIIVSYEHHIPLSICLVCVEYRVGLMMKEEGGRGLTRWNTEIYHDGYTPPSRPQTTDRKWRQQKLQKASLLTSSFFTQNLRCLTFRASENFTIGKALKNNIKRFLPRDHVCWNNRTVQNTIREKLSMVTSGNGKY